MQSPENKYTAHSSKILILIKGKYVKDDAEIFWGKKQRLVCFSHSYLIQLLMESLSLEEKNKLHKPKILSN